MQIYAFDANKYSMTNPHQFYKSIILVIFIIFQGSIFSQSFPSAVLKGTFTVTADRKENITDVSWKGACGLTLSAVKSKTFTLKADCYSKITEQDSSPVFNAPDFSITAGLFSNKLQIAAGNLGTGRTVSLLRKPAPAVKTSAVKKTFTFTPGISFSSPSLSSASKPGTVFCSATVPVNKSASLFFSGFLSEENSASISAGTKIKFSKTAFLHLNATTGFFELKGNSQYLKKNSVSFENFDSVVFCAESSFQSYPFKISLTSTIHQSPWNIWWYTFILKSRLTAGPFLLDFDFFTIPSAKDSPAAVPLISTDSTVIKTLEQAQLNPQFVFITSSGSLITTGISLTETWKLEGNVYPSPVNTLRCNFTVLYEQKNCSLNINIFSAGNLLYGNPGSQFMPEKYTGVSLSGRKTFDYGTVNGTFSAKQYTPNAKNDTLKQTLSENMTFTSALIPDLKAGISASQTLKNGLKEKNSVSLSINKAIKNRFSQITLKAQFKTEF